jgi:hypothetical protein
MSYVDTSIKIGQTSYSVEDLLNYADNGTLDSILEPELQSLSGDEITEFVTELYALLDEAKGDYDKVINGIEEDIDDLDRDTDEDLYDVKKDRYEEDIDEIDALIEEIDDTLYNAIEECATEYGSLHVRTSDDIAFTPTVDYENGDVVEIQATGGKAAASTDGYDGEDVTGDSLVTYHDYDQYLVDQASTNLSTDQGIILNLEPEDTVESMSYSNGILSVKIKSSRSGKIVTLEISGISNGVDLYFEFGSESQLSSSVTSGLPPEIKKQIYVNEEVYSLYELGIERTDEEKLSFIDRFDEIKEGAIAVTNEFAQSPASVLPYVEQGLEIMFGYLNDPEQYNGSRAEAMAAYLDVLEQISDETTKSDALVSFVMTMVKEAGQNYFQGLLGDTIPTLIEEIFLADETLTTNEKMACLILEMQSGGVGKFGGVESLSLTTGVSASDEGSLANVGGIFFIDAETKLLTIHDELWQDEATTREALAAYKKLILETGWTGDTGAIDEILGYFDSLDAYNEAPKITNTYATAVNDALRALSVDSKARTDVNAALFDGIKGSVWYSKVKELLNILKSGKDFPLEDVVTQLRAGIESLEDKHDGDVLSSFIFYLYYSSDAGPDLLSAIFEVDPDLKLDIQCAIEGEKTPPYHAYEVYIGNGLAAFLGLDGSSARTKKGALSILQEYQTHNSMAKIMDQIPV